jgi:hypothetical protein
MERRVQLSWCKSSSVLWPLSRVPPKGLNLQLMGLLIKCRQEVDGEVSTAELVQNFRRLNPPPPAESSLQGFEFSTNGFVDVVLGGGGWRGEYS